LQGKVIVVVKSPLPGGTVTLLLQGKEKILGQRGGKAERRFFRVFLPLSKNTETRQPGTYMLPFVIPLPISLPSSSKYPPNDSNGFRIQYKMQATLGNSLKQTRYVLIASAPLPDERVGIIAPPISIPVKMGDSILAQKSALLAARISDTHVGRGDDFDLHLACHNESAVDITCVQIRIVEDLHWGAAVHSFTHHATIVLLQLNDIQIPGLARNKNSQKEAQPQHRGLSEDDQAAVHRYMHEDLMSGDCRLTVTIPTHARDSYAGQLVRIVHYLEVTLQTPTTTAITNSSVRVPLRIGSPPSTDSPSTYRVRSSGESVNPIDATLARLSDHSIPPPMPASDVIPMITAVSLPNTVIESHALYATDDDMVLGGDAVLLTALSELRPPPAAPVPYPLQIVPQNVSMEGLLSELQSSINEYDTIQEKLGYKSWVQFFGSMLPDNFGSIIAHVTVESDQPLIASLLAPHVGIPFTCCYAAAALRHAAAWTRYAMVEQLLPCCTDITAEQQVIRAELTEWELIITQQYFDQATSVAI
jgi:hypothetical protein